jgi:NAD(P)-dependent dehydrogenase (short-subunit alcohol dehydrogenase family)
MLHPLLQRNTSDLSKQKFTSILSGEESFLRDHLVKGKSVLPGVAYLEMARAAVAASTGFLKNESAVVKLHDVVWLRPIVVDTHTITVEISVAQDDRGGLSYEISSLDDQHEPVVHGQGSAALVALEPPRERNLLALRAACSKGAISSAQLYAAFAEMGIEYGPQHRGVIEVYVGSDALLAKLSLPFAQWEEGRYVVHPGMLDSAIQASLAFLLTDAGGEAARAPIMPFSLGEVEVFGPCVASMWAHITRSVGTRAGDRVQKVDLELCDEQGRVAVRLKGLSSRRLKGEHAVGATSRSIMLAPIWEAFVPRRVSTFPGPSARVCIVGGTAAHAHALELRFPREPVLKLDSADAVADIARRLQAHGTIDHLVWIAPQIPIASIADEAIIEQQERGVLGLFRIAKALLALGYETKELGWTIVTTQAQRVHREDRVDPSHAAVHGFIGSMAKEFPSWNARLIDVEGRWSFDELFTLPADPDGNAIVHRNQQWHRQKLVPITGLSGGSSPYRRGGVYVVIGGAGGIGEIWSEHMIRAYQAHIVWIGRREQDAKITAQLERLAQFGPAPLYIAADATDYAALHGAHERIKQRHPHIHGLVHSALLLLDKGLLNMDEARFRAGLAPKVDATVRMAQVFGAELLDFVLFFSSMSAFVKASGQSNYSAGCTFKDAYALRMARDWACAVKVVDWGYWGTVGIVASKEYQERMALQGVGSIEPAEAMQALDALLQGPFDQVAFMKAIGSETADEKFGDETIEAYPETTPSAILGLKDRIFLPRVPIAADSRQSGFFPAVESAPQARSYG